MAPTIRKRKAKVNILQRRLDARPGDLGLATWNLELGTWNLELGTWNLELRECGSMPVRAYSVFNSVTKLLSIRRCGFRAEQRRSARRGCGVSGLQHETA